MSDTIGLYFVISFHVLVTYGCYVDLVSCSFVFSLGESFGEARGRERRERKDGIRVDLGRGENGWGRGRVSLTSHYIPETDPRAFICPFRVNAAGPEAEERAATQI